MEAEKPVQQNIKVSEITTAFVTQLVPMPICRYEILEGGPTGKPVDFAVVGQQVKIHVLNILEQLSLGISQMDL